MLACEDLSQRCRKRWKALLALSKRRGLWPFVYCLLSSLTCAKNARGGHLLLSPLAEYRSRTKYFNRRDFLRAIVRSEELRIMTPTTCTWCIVCPIIAHSQVDHLASLYDSSAMLSRRRCIQKNVIWIVYSGVCWRPSNHYHSSLQPRFAILLYKKVYVCVFASDERIQ